MKDEKIFKITTITTIVGLFALILTSSYVNPELLKISHIDNSKIDNQVQVEGVVTSYTTTKSGTKILKLSDETGSIDVIIFPSTSISSPNFENKKVKITGKVTQYHGQLELVIEDSRNIKIQ